MYPEFNGSGVFCGKPQQKMRLMQKHFSWKWKVPYNFMFIFILYVWELRISVQLSLERCLKVYIWVGVLCAKQKIKNNFKFHAY